MIKILVVEDDETLRKILKDKLTQEGFTLLTA
ncbi:DNA-binding response regulator, partial [candidate division WWE3 bacterium CG_4_10_14_0_2_um_filter_42_7]